MRHRHDEQKGAVTGYVVCVDNSDYPVSLELHKIYRASADQDALADGYIRVLDESGEDYLFPASMFVTIDPPEQVRSSLAPTTATDSGREPEPLIALDLEGGWRDEERRASDGHRVFGRADIEGSPALYCHHLSHGFSEHWAQVCLAGLHRLIAPARVHGDRRNGLVLQAVRPSARSPQPARRSPARCDQAPPIGLLRVLRSRPRTCRLLHIRSSRRTPASVESAGHHPWAAPPESRPGDSHRRSDT